MNLSNKRDLTIWLSNLARHKRKSMPIAEQVLSILNRYNATMLLPGVNGVLRFGYQPGNYRESTGQTLAGADQQVGLVVDAARVPGPELIPDTGFDNPAGWSTVQPTSGSVTVSGSAVRVNTTDGSFCSISRSEATPIVAGRTYQYEIVIVSTTGFGVRVDIGGVTSTSFSTVGTHRGVATAIGTAKPALVRVNGGATDTTVTSFSVRELPGIHASQSTSGFQPVLRRGLLNQLLWSSDFSNAAWSKDNVSLAVTGSAPWGNETTVTPTTNAATRLDQRSVFAQSTEVTFAFLVRNTSVAASQPILFRLRNNTTATNLATATYDPSSNAATGVAGLSSADIGNGWLLCAYSQTTGISVGNEMRVYLGFTGAAHTVADRVVLGPCALFTGTVTADQIIAAGGIPVTTTSPASSANGIQSLQFDGTDDRLSLSAVPFQMADDSFAVVGFRSDDDTNRNPFSLTGGALAAFAIKTISGNVSIYARSDSGASLTISNTRPYSTGSNVVVSTDIKTGQASLYLDGVFSASGDVGSLGATTFTASTIGGLPSAQFHNGLIHGLIVGKWTISASERQTLVRFMASLQGRNL